ncbi:MAG: hypothetical protein A2W25_14975 [candidate division Zixibacteria bacterium RBG_16_53_22]|nr:MAG: hypothetical protein A2W25_14975 [candidate division Zixibacteria bacterium RBG_16_53_22]
MINWVDIQKEIKESNPGGLPDLDGVRRRRIRALADYRKRPLIIYASDFLNAKKAALAGTDISLDWSDKLGFVEVTQSLEKGPVDILLHSPGGSADAVQSIVDILRSKFTDIAFIIPNIAKSAATMLALSGNLLIMDEMSELGPIDPQFVIPKRDGVIQAAGQAIIDQFDEAQKLIAADPKMLVPWIPILQQYGPALYMEAKNAIKFSRDMVKRWLEKYMFCDDHLAAEKAEAISTFLSSHKNFLSHRKKIGLTDICDEEELRELKIHDMNSDLELKDRVRAVYLAIDATFQLSGVFKMFENNLDQAMFRVIQVVATPNQ